MQSYTNENLTQTFSILNNSNYLLQFQWMPPYFNPMNKSMAIIINGLIIDIIYINSSNYLLTSINNYSIEVQLLGGSNTL